LRVIPSTCKVSGELETGGVIMGRSGIGRMELSKRQRDTLQAIRNYRERWGIAPSFDELAETLGVTKPTVRQHIRALRRKGYIRQTPGVPRSLVLVID